MKYQGNLQRIRQERGYSQSQLAVASGVSLRMIQYYEQGAKDINQAAASTVWRLAEALNCHMEEIIDTQNIDF